MNIRLIVLAFSLCLFLSSQAQLDNTEKKLVKFVDANNAQAELLLKNLVNINSGTMNFEGVRKVGEILMQKFSELGMETRWEDGSSFNRAGHLVAKVQGGKGKKILIIGHLDTVFEPDSPNQKWIAQDQNIVRGPGIADMKGGDVIILQSLTALHQAGLLSDMNIWVVMTGDEELSGDPLSESKKALIEAAKWADIALGFENGDGNPATVNVARRSSSDWTLTVKGNASHSSQIFKPTVGTGAIYEASRIIYNFYNELAGEEFLTFSPGLFLGGTEVKHDKTNSSGTAFGKNNVVAKDVIVTGDIRCLTPEQLERAQKKMTEIVSKHLPGADASIVFGDGYPPFAPTEGNYTLMNKFSQVSEDLGFGKVTAANPSNAGAADISFTSAYIEMGIDGLGLAGTHGHTIDETGDLRALPMQAKRSAILLYRLMKEY